MSHLVIANPNSAGGKGERVLPALERALGRAGIDYTLRRTERPGHAREIARSLPFDTPRLLVVGGDGTIHEVVSGLLEREFATDAADFPPIPEIAVLPVGTGNDFHRMVRASKGIDDAVRALVSGVARSFEVGEVRWDGGRDHFVNLIGVGIDVEVLRRREAFRMLPGLLQYLGALVSALIHHRPTRLKVTHCMAGEASVAIEAPMLLSAVTVGPSIGGGFLLSPSATPDDGLLDLFVVRHLGYLRILRYLPGVLRGTGDRRDGIWQLQGESVEIEALDDEGFDFEIDGELMVASTRRLEIRVRPDSLRILEPSPVDS